MFKAEGIITCSLLSFTQKRKIGNMLIKGAPSTEMENDYISPFFGIKSASKPPSH